MRSKGYILKSGLKFGCDFRVYEKKKDHAKWLLFVTKDSAKLQWKTFSGMARVANSTKKNVLVAIVDSENSPTYFEIAWKKI
jgi:tRNA-intron endonuclease